MGNRQPVLVPPPVQHLVPQDTALVASPPLRVCEFCLKHRSVDHPLFAVYIVCERCRMFFYAWKTVDEEDVLRFCKNIGIREEASTTARILAVINVINKRRKASEHRRRYNANIKHLRPLNRTKFWKMWHAASAQLGSNPY